MILIRIAGLVCIALGGWLGYDTGKAVWLQFFKESSRLTRKSKVMFIGDWLLEGDEVHLVLGGLAIVAIALLWFGIYMLLLTRQSDV